MQLLITIYLVLQIEHPPGLGLWDIVNKRHTDLLITKP